MIKIEPQPRWEEEPGKDWDGSYCGRYMEQRSADGDFSIEVDVHKPPTPNHEPVKIDGTWYWRLESAQEAQHD